MLPGVLNEKEFGDKVELKIVEITSTGRKSLGDRVCIDLLTNFQEGEGLLIGACSRGLFLMHSETIENQWVPNRPFRVNAGPVSLYIMIPNGKTKYLSELGGGSLVLAVNYNGESKTVTVGRSKTETRPLLLIKAKYTKEGMKTMKFHTFVQNAETIAFVDKEGKAIPVTKLKKGDKVLACVRNPKSVGRHIGVDAEEFICEK